VDYNSKQRIFAVIQGYGTWVNTFISEGWNAYLVTFMFKPLPGNRHAIINQMQRKVEAFYSTLVTRVVRYNRSKDLQHLLPRLIGAPDVPVFKHAKQSISDVCINDGLHFHAIVLIPKRCRLRVDLAQHVQDKYQAYVHKDGRLTRIDVQPITETPKKVTGYGLKAVKNGITPNDDILILPKSLSELGAREKRKPPKKREPIRRAGQVKGKPSRTGRITW